MHCADNALVAGPSQWHDADRAQKECDQWIGKDRCFRSETHATRHGVCYRQRVDQGVGMIHGKKNRTGVWNPLDPVGQDRAIVPTQRHPDDGFQQSIQHQRPNTD